MLCRALERLQAVKSSNCLNQDAASESVESDKESSVQLIQLDIARTFPLLCIFQKVCYPDVTNSCNLSNLDCFREVRTTILCTVYLVPMCATVLTLATCRACLS